MGNELLYNVQGLKVKYSDEFEEIYYYNDDMLERNVIFVEGTLLMEESNVQTMISVKHFNDTNAHDWVLYWSDLLSPIQVYRIIIDIHELFKGSSLGHFIEFVDGLSVSSMSSAMQSKKKNRDDIMNRIKLEIKSLQMSSD